MLSVFAFIITVQVAVAAISIDVLSAVRAYVSGESLYSKGQKDAQIHLLDYIDSHREEDYQSFRRALAVPIGDRLAREELQRPNSDMARVEAAFLQAGNHPDDLSGLIRLFRWFHNVPYMAEPIATWAKGDRLIEQVEELVERAHERVSAGDLNAPAVVQMRDQATQLNRTLTALTSKFSAQLGDASRQTQRVLLGLNLGLALLLALSGLGFVRHSSRVQAATEDEVRHRQESLQRLLDSSAEGLFGIDLEGKCTFINRAALAMLGYEREADLLGRDIHALIHHTRPDGSPYPASESRMYQAFRERQELHVTDEVFWRRDGSSFPVEYWAHPVLQDDEVQGAVATFFDITERLIMQAALREGELRIAKLVDAVTDAVITVDPEERVVLFNRAAEQVFGVSAAEAIGSSIRRFIPQLPAGWPLGPLAAAAAVEPGARSAAAVHELKGIRASRDEFPLEASLSRLETERGILTTVVLRDVTELHVARAERRAREALEATSLAKTEFLSRMSHELRTPLNAVLGFSQLLRLDAGKPSTEKQLERIQHIENAGTHLLALVNDVLDLSRVESGQIRLALQPVHLPTLIEDASAMVSTLAAHSHVTLTPVEHARLLRLGDASGEIDDQAVEGAGAWVLADPVRVRQVLVNLLSNAVKYNREGGTVAVGWQPYAGSCHISVRDTGLGMSPEKLARLFEPFNRLGAEKSKIEGTGIGLVLSRGLVELMGGELRIESAVGRGTVATLVLKSSDEPFLIPALHAPPSQHGALDGRLSVMYAEDNEVNVELVRQVFALRPAVGLRVAESGARALAMARQDPPDLMLVDMNLGDMTGIELAQALQREPSTAAIRLVALSADALPEQIQAAMQCGFEAYLTKPIDFRKLLNVIDGKSPDDRSALVTEGHMAKRADFDTFARH